MLSVSSNRYCSSEYILAKSKGAFSALAIRRQDQEKYRVRSCHMLLCMTRQGLRISEPESLFDFRNGAYCTPISPVRNVVKMTSIRNARKGLRSATTQLTIASFCPTLATPLLILSQLPAGTDADADLTRLVIREIAATFTTSGTLMPSKARS